MPLRLSKPQLLHALREASGNVSVLARRLRITRKTLYAHFSVHDLDPAEFRPKTAAIDCKTDDPSSTFDTPADYRTSASPSEQNGSGPTVPLVPAQCHPTTRRLRTIKTLSLRKDLLVSLAQARRRLALALDLDLTDATMLELFIADKLDTWITEKTAEAEQSRAPRLVDGHHSGAAAPRSKGDRP